MKYYEHRDVYGKPQTDKHWEKSKDPDGVIRNKTTEREQKLEDLQEELAYLNALSGGMILDVGCGLGFALEALDAKWEKYGLDTSKYACKHAKRFGNIHEGPIESCGYNAGIFDAILCYHVIEHVDSPEVFLREINRLLRIEGKLVISTPDFDSPAARYWGSKFRLLKDNSHISLFSRAGLHDMLRDWGFEVERVSSPYFGTRHHNIENLKRLAPPDEKEAAEKVSPPCPGNIVTFYCHKAKQWVPL